MNWWHWIVVGFFAGVGLAFGTALGNGIIGLFAGSRRAGVT